MTNTNIHGFNVDYDETSHTLNLAVHYLAEKLDESEAKAFFDEARRDLINHKAHFEIRDPENGRDHELTLIHDSDGSYHLRKKLVY